MAKPGKKRGVRIPEIEDDRGDRCGPSEIDHQPHPRYVKPLKCGGCGSRVSARHGNADDPDGRSPHYFKIEPHKPNFKYDLDQRGKQLVNSSQGTVVRHPGQWRLICPPLDHLGTGGSTKQPATPARLRRPPGLGPYTGRANRRWPRSCHARGDRMVDPAGRENRSTVSVTRFMRTATERS
ncbi:hypothetical protein [Streptomyces sp. NPDC002547]